MGINITQKIEYTCDKCFQPCPSHFTSKSVQCGGDGRDVINTAYVSVKYERGWCGNQIICNNCAISIMKDVIKELEK